jgi:hypothetical protein
MPQHHSSVSHHAQGGAFFLFSLDLAVKLA